MNYCKKCSKVFSETGCPVCKKTGREVKDEDFILVGKFGLLKANMIEPILKDNGIPYLRKTRERLCG